MQRSTNPPLHIAVNARTLKPGILEGIGRFTFETLQYITTRHPDVRFSLFFDGRPDPSFIFGDNVTLYTLYPPMRHPFLYYTWLEFSVAHAIRRLHPDLFFSPDGFLSLGTTIPQIPVIHDLGFEHQPEHTKWWDGRYYRMFFPQYARMADQILTVSEYSKNDIATTYGIPPERITPVYNGCSQGFSPTDSETHRRTRAQYSDGCNYFVYVGALQPRKNIENLLLAYDRFREIANADVKLVIVGRMAWKNRRMLEIHQSMTYADDVMFTGYVDDRELNKLYGGAIALVYVPIFEGFGIPVLEAFNAETAVITSNVSSLPEVAGDAALLVSPNRIEQIAEAMARLARDGTLRATLIERGRRQRKNFSWEKTGELTWQAILETLDTRATTRTTP